MRNTKAKQLRLATYGPAGGPMPRRYFFAKDRSLRLSGPRAAYQQAKRHKKNETITKVEALPKSQWQRKPVWDGKVVPPSAPVLPEKKKRGFLSRLKASIQKILRRNDDKNREKET